MEPHELMKDVLKRTSAKQIAADLGLSLSLIYKWTEEPMKEGDRKSTRLNSSHT